MSYVRRLHFLGGMTLLFATLCLPTMLSAQTTGTMSGYVKDPSRAFIPHARVTATQTHHGTVYTTETGAEGFYNFPALEPGRYILTIEKAAFRRTIRAGLNLTVRQNLRVDAVLEVGAVSQAVSVTSQATLVDTTSGTISGLVDDRGLWTFPSMDATLCHWPAFCRVC
ncbi:MAG: carboxypeptidase-like regulatory domain-containing protein [Terriglobia bacterium]